MDDASINDVAERAVTHVMRVERVMVQFGQLIHAYHLLNVQFALELPEQYILDAIPILDREAVLAEEVSEALVTMNHDLRELLTLLGKLPGG